MVNMWPFGRKSKASVPVLDVDKLPNASVNQPPERFTSFNGESFAGGFGYTKIFWNDYTTLRDRSRQLFTENLYARGMIRRLVTNEINKGLQLEALPDSGILGLDEEMLEDWSETLENKFSIWAQNPLVCDYHQKDTFGAMQRMRRRMALIDGDVLCVKRNNRDTRLPSIQLIPGASVVSPFNNEKLKKGHDIIHGVELDDKKRQVAYWVVDENGDGQRIPAFSKNGNRRIAWLSYGIDNMIDDVRGMPMLGLIMQSMQELNRYKDASLRKATLNALLTMFIKKDQPNFGTKPISKAAASNIELDAAGDTSASDRKRNFSLMNPGIIFEELAYGETPEVHSTSGTDINLGAFEEAIIRAMAWAHEVPPAIMTLGFSSNYSASQGEIKEFKMYLDRIRNEHADTFNKPVYQDWLQAKVLLGDIKANGLIQASMSISEYEKWGAWVQSDWSGAIKPSTDLLKETKGYALGVGKGWLTNDRASKELHGTKFSHNTKRLKRENEQWVAAMRPIWEAQAEFGEDVVGKKNDPTPASDNIGAMDESTIFVDADTGEEFVEGENGLIPLVESDG